MPLALFALSRSQSQRKNEHVKCQSAKRDRRKLELPCPDYFILAVLSCHPAWEILCWQSCSGNSHVFCSSPILKSMKGNQKWEKKQKYKSTSVNKEGALEHKIAIATAHKATKESVSVKRFHLGASKCKREGQKIARAHLLSEPKKSP